MSKLNSGNGKAVLVNQDEAFSKKDDKNKLLDGLSTIGRSAVSTVLQYIDEMDPSKPKSEKDAIQYQVGLYRALTLTINKNDQDFNKTWGTILQLVNENLKGVFHDSKVFHYMHSTSLTDEKRKVFQRLLHLLKSTAPMQGRAFVLKQMDFKKIFIHDITPVGAQRLLNFYQRFMQ